VTCRCREVPCTAGRCWSSPNTDREDPGMSFGEAIQSVFRNYAEFTGRATRPEFWWWALFNLLVVGALNLFNVISIGENADLGFPARRSLGHRGLAAEPRRRRPTTARRRLRLGPPVLDPGPHRRDLRARHPVGAANEAGGAGDDRRDRVAARPRSGRRPRRSPRPGTHPGFMTNSRRSRSRCATAWPSVRLPAVKAAGLDGLRFHDLRHTAVALWIAAGAIRRRMRPGRTR
jgi:Protein of unknown function (DUF805)